jgi:hypothetical protein
MEKMCVESKEVRQIVDEQLNIHHRTLEKLLDLHFKRVDEKFQAVNDRLDKINGRVGKSEQAIKIIEGHEPIRANTCPFKDDVKVLKDEFLRDVTITEYLKEQESIKQEQEKIKEKRREARERKTRTLVSVVGAIVTIATFLINYFL